MRSSWNQPDRETRTAAPASLIRPLITLTALLTFALAALVPMGALAQEAAPEVIMERLERALNAHDEEAALGLFTDDARIRGEGTLEGANDLRSWVREQVGGNVHVHVGSYEVEGNRARWVAEIGEGEWYRRGPAPIRAEGEVEVRNGKITRLSYRRAEVPRQEPPPVAYWRVPRDASSPDPFELPLPLLLGAVAGVGSVLLAGPLWRRRRLQPGDERGELGMGGALHSGLRQWAAGRRR